MNSEARKRSKILKYSPNNAFITISSRNRTVCSNWKCRRVIKKGSYRIDIKYRWPAACYHINCFPNSPNVKHPEISSYEEILYPKGYTALSKTQKDRFVKAMKCHWLKYAKLKLNKKFRDMKKKDLEYELEKRDIRAFFGDRNKLQNQLQRFLDGKNCQKFYDLVVFGYCRTFEMEYELMLPTYLQQIVRKYYPPFV